MKDVDYQWQATYQKAFYHMKLLICSDTPLHYYDVHKPAIIQINTSKHGLGAAPLQNGKPVAFTSKHLTPVEQHYANVKWELLAVAFRAKPFPTYMFG